MKKKPLVSVVIPVYKVEIYLKDSVISVVEQTYGNIEIILVNDGSPDNCPMICDGLAAQYENISVIHKKNGGLSEARNYGIRKAVGEYILFLDSDDMLEKDAIEGLIIEAIEHKADLVIPDRYTQIFESTNTQEIRFHFDETGYIENPVTFAIDVMIGKGRAWRASALLYNYSLIKDNNIEFPVGYIAEDIVFNLAVMSKAKKVTFYKKSTLNYLKRTGSITSSFQKNLDNVFLFIDKKIELFLQETNQNNEYSDNKRDELLCRNTIIYISELFSKKCKFQKYERIEKADKFLEEKRVKEAFNVNEIKPYFKNKIVIIYFQIMFRLIKAKKKNSAYYLSGFAGKFL